MDNSRQSRFLEVPLRSARRTATAATALLGVGAFAAQAPAQDYVAIENNEVQNVLARDPAGHWTPTELMTADPLSLPQPPQDKQIFLDQARNVTETTIERAGRVAATVTPNLDAPAAGDTQADGENVPAAAEVPPDLADRLFPASALQMIVPEPGAGQQPEESGAPAEPGSPGSAPPERAEAVQPAEEEPGAETVGDIARPDVFQPLDVGTAGAYFSSSRLIPTDARLHYPYRAIGKLFFEKPGGGSFICSGAVIKPRLILTAGHCVHSGGAGGFYQRFLFVPAYHQGQAPYQAWNWTWVTTTGPWSTGNSVVPNKADFAIIEVEDRKFDTQVKKIGEVTGMLGYRTNALMPNHNKKIGYPGNFDSGQIMHQVDSQHHLAAAQDTVLYGSDMGGGSSGGPWVENFGVQAAGQTGGLKPWPNRVIGVTSYGYVSTDPKVQGSSILNQDFLNILNAACAHKAGNC
jgi:V8-like Glu-specific endopeptidase